MNFHFDRYMWYLFAENEVFVGERRDGNPFLKIVILNKTNNDCIFCKDMIHYVYTSNQKRKIYGYVSAISVAVRIF